MIRISGIKIPITRDNPEELKRNICSRLNIRNRDLLGFSIFKQSIDARKAGMIYLVYTVDAEIANEREILARNTGHSLSPTPDMSYKFVEPGDTPLPERPVIIGTGPAGLFAGLILAEMGYRPLLLERGLDAQRRRAVVNRFWKEGVLDPECNVQFGEGGAGTFSDGKLTTQTKDPRNRKVLEEFKSAGAPEDILYSNRPHVGTDKLVTTVQNLREKIISAGGEVRFASKLTDLRIEDGLCQKGETYGSSGPAGSQQLGGPAGSRGFSPTAFFGGGNSPGASIKLGNSGGQVELAGLGERNGLRVSGKSGRLHGILVNESQVIPASVLVLAIGHSARDTYRMLYSRGIKMAQKAFSIGARIEHPQELIDQTQYGSFAGHPKLGAADYKLAYHSPNGRTAYTFCMCPGGTVVAAASEPGHVATNGMSEYARDGRNANSAFLVNVGPGDFGSNHPLAGIAFQQQWEQLAFILGGGSYSAPVQLLGDFLQDRKSTSLGGVKPTYLPGVRLADLRECLPSFIVETLKEAVPHLDKKLKGFGLEEAVLTGVETRSSSPVRLLRDEDFQSNIAGIYPAGEGAGYAGGIVSSAVDGIKVAEAIARKYRPFD